MKIQQKLQALFEILEQAEEMVMITDTKGEIKYSNAAYRKFIFGPYSNPHLPSSTQKTKQVDAELIENHLQFIIPGVYQGNIDEIKTWIKGNQYDLKILIAPLWNKKGEITNFIAIERAIYRRLDGSQSLNDKSHKEVIQKNSYSSKRIIHAASLITTRLLPKLSPSSTLENFINTLMNAGTISSDTSSLENIYCFNKFECIDFPSLIHNVLNLVKSNYPDKPLTDKINPEGQIYCEPAKVWLLLTKVFGQIMESNLGKFKVNVIADYVNNSQANGHKTDNNDLLLQININPNNSGNRSDLIDFEEGKYNLVGELNYYLFGDQSSIQLKTCRIRSAINANEKHEITVNLIFPGYAKK